MRRTRGGGSCWGGRNHWSRRREKGLHWDVSIVHPLKKNDQKEWLLPKPTRREQERAQTQAQAGGRTQPQEPRQAPETRTQARRERTPAQRREAAHSGWWRQGLAQRVVRPKPQQKPKTNQPVEISKLAKVFSKKNGPLGATYTRGGRGGGALGGLLVWQHKTNL
jgi:hypothetical protein